MKLLGALLGATVLVFCCQTTEGWQDRKILISKFGTAKAKSLPEIEHIRTALRTQTLANLKSLPQTVKIDLLKLAESELKGAYPVKTAIEFIEYSRNGNREHYQDKMHQHRSRLAILVVGQLLEHEVDAKSVKFLNEVVNGVWMLLEESSWAYPAHIGGHLPAPGSLELELNTGEVAKLLSWIRLLLAEQFDHISPVINKRIDYELHRRIFQDFLAKNYGWEGFQGSHSVNNWNIWINTNILKSALLTLNDAALFEKVLHKTMQSADYFLDTYGDDGGCDEGPSYWRHAGGRLIEYIESLEQLFGADARKYFAGIGLIKLIGEYTYKMRIDRNWFVNFADARPVITYPPSLLAKFGDLLDDEGMRHFSAYMSQFAVANSTVASAYFVKLLQVDHQDVNNYDLNEFLNFVNSHKQIESYKKEAPELEHAWMDHIQVVTARSRKGATSKLFLGAKAGHNHESHNHNDVGSFILFQDGNPVMIDIGVGTYTAKTFGPHRYDLFYMQSQYHNCPTINGIQQHDGPYTSRNTTFHVLPNNEGIHFQSDIAGAYPATSHAKHWVRSLHFNQSSNVIQLEDQYQLDKHVAPQELHFIVYSGVVIEKTTTGLHLHQTGKVNLLMDFDWKLLEMKVEDKSLEGDHHQTQFWGEMVKRLTLVTTNHSELNGKLSVRFLVAK